MLGRMIWLLRKSCYGKFRARTKKEGSRWFGGKSAGKQREKGIRGAGCVQTGCCSAACPAVPAPTSDVSPERCFQPFLNINKDAQDSLNNFDLWMN